MRPVGCDGAGSPGSLNLGSTTALCTSTWSNVRELGPPVLQLRPTWANLGQLSANLRPNLRPTWGPGGLIGLHFYSVFQCLRENRVFAAQSRPGGPKRRSGGPRAGPEGPGAAQERPKGRPRVATSGPRAMLTPYLFDLSSTWWVII